MTADEYEKLPASDRKRLMECPHCGKILSLEEVLLHVAHDGELADIAYSGSERLD